MSVQWEGGLLQDTEKRELPLVEWFEWWLAEWRAKVERSREAARS